MLVFVDFVFAGLSEASLGSASRLCGVSSDLGSVFGSDALSVLDSDAASLSFFLEREDEDFFLVFDDFVSSVSVEVVSPVVPGDSVCSAAGVPSAGVDAPAGGSSEPAVAEVEGSFEDGRSALSAVSAASAVVCEVAPGPSSMHNDMEMAINGFDPAEKLEQIKGFLLLVITGSKPSVLLLKIIVLFLFSLRFLFVAHFVEYF